MESSKTHFILKGFSQVLESRVFEFEGLMPDSVRASFTVSINMAMARRYGIRLQEMPLLCRTVLDQTSEGEQQRAFTYSEAHMSEYAGNVAAREEAAKHKRAPKQQPAPETAAATHAPGANWRFPPR